MPTMEKFTELGTELDREGYEWLVENYPAIATAVEVSVGRGATPEGVRRFVLERLGPERSGLAIRCQSAARYLAQAR